MRIRTIKPEFWKSESVGRLGRDARILFIGLWNHADDEGRFRAAPELIKAELFPYDEIKPSAILGWIKELSENDRMVVLWKGEDGNQYGWIPKFRKHQRIDKPQASKLPKPPDICHIPRTFQEHSKNTLGLFPVGLEGNGMEGNGMEGGVGGVSLPFDSGAFKEAWTAWKEHRRRIRKPMTDRAQELILKKLPKDEPTAIAWINNAIEKGWQGIYEPDSGGSYPSNRTPVQPIPDHSKGF
jgi:hypothetical protein